MGVRQWLRSGQPWKDFWGLLLARLYAVARLFVNFFQPSFKLAQKHRDGAHVSKRYHPPQTPCERLLQAENIPMSAKNKLREVAGTLDPLKLLEEIRAVQAHLMALADGDKAPALTSEPPDLARFIASLSNAWRAGETRPTFNIEAKPRYLRALHTVPQALAPVAQQVAPPLPSSPSVQVIERPRPIYAEIGNAKFHSLRMVWPLVGRRLEGHPNINCTQLFDELCLQFPGRFTRCQYKGLLRRVNRWRRDARARGVVIGTKTYRRFSTKPRGTRPSPFAGHWTEMLQCLEAQPDQTALELLIEFRARYPERYTLGNLRALQRRVKVWRHEAVQRLICEMKGSTQDVTTAAC